MRGGSKKLNAGARGLKKRIYDEDGGSSQFHQIWPRLPIIIIVQNPVTAVCFSSLTAFGLVNLWPGYSLATMHIRYLTQRLKNNRTYMKTGQ